LSGFLMPERNELFGFVEQTAAVDDFIWGLLTLSDDALYHRFSQSQIEEIIKESLTCGENEAIRLLESFPQQGPEEIALELGLPIRMVDFKISEKSKIIFFGQYVKSAIVISEDTIKEIENQSKIAGLTGFLENISIKSVLIAHELFHYCEEKNNKLTTCTMKIRIKTFNLFFQNVTPLCASEIAAFSFAKKLSNLNFHPRILEVIGVYGVKPDLSRSIVKRLMAFANKEA